MEFIVDAQLSDTECLDALRWSLTGEATDYFDFIMKERDDLHFINALQVMEKRFSFITVTYIYIPGLPVCGAKTRRKPRSVG